MISYTTVGTNDLAAAVKFYDEIFQVNGAAKIFDTDRFVAWSSGQESPFFSVIKPYDEQPASVGNGVMIALGQENQDKVNEIYTKAISLGAKDEGAPGIRGDTFYCAYVRDLDGNKLNFCCMAET